jgi:hypothetical protein
MPKKTKPYEFPKAISRYVDAAVDLASAMCTGSDVDEREADAEMTKARTFLEKWCKANNKKLAKTKKENDLRYTVGATDKGGKAVLKKRGIILDDADQENSDGDSAELKPTHGWS